MKKMVLSLGLLATTGMVSAQQIGNSDFEQWGSVSSGEEPTNWNSFLTAGGSLSWAAGNQLQSSTDVRPGSSGTKSAKIFSNETLGIIANGNLTVGKINMGSATPANSANYNSSITSDANFSEALTQSPDSLVFWAKFTPADTSGADSARVSAIIHDAYDFRDPIDGNSAPHVVAAAIKNYGYTYGSWVRMSVPFTYSGPASTPAFILVTFTTNKTPGGGSDNDQVWIDDVELIYNASSASVNENADFAHIGIQNHELVITSAEPLQGQVAIYQMNGQLVHQGSLDQGYTFNQSGVYIVRLATEKGVMTTKLVNY